MFVGFELDIDCVKIDVSGFLVFVNVEFHAIFAFKSNQENSHAQNFSASEQSFLFLLASSMIGVHEVFAVFQGKASSIFCLFPVIILLINLNQLPIVLFPAPKYVEEFA
jgi:hypothetical protein